MNLRGVEGVVLHADSWKAFFREVIGLNVL